MKLSNVTYAQFDHVLTELGFLRSSDLPADRRYLHPESDTVVLLPNAPDNAYVPIAYVQGHGRILDERGVVDRHRFEQMLRTDRAA